jgi:hypothetical protein
MFVGSQLVWALRALFYTLFVSTVRARCSRDLRQPVNLASARPRGRQRKTEAA